MAGRTNQYFIPGDGISREVIQADICRYLGNDALVRPGNYQGREGYFLTAYRNLTSAMIADLKADSQRWEAEKREGELRGYNPVPYRTSTTHQSRQYYGPSEGGVPPGPVYVTAQQSQPQPGYDNQTGAYYTQPGSGYGGQSASQSAGYGGGYAPGANYQPGEPRSSYPSYPQAPGREYDPNNTSDSSAYPPSGAPRAQPPANYQPRDPFGRGGYNYPH